MRKRDSILVWPKMLKIIIVFIGQIIWKLILVLGLFVVPLVVFFGHITWDIGKSVGKYGFGIFKGTSTYLVDSAGNVINKGIETVDTIDKAQNEAVKQDWKSGKEILKECWNMGKQSAKNSFNNTKGLLKGEIKVKDLIRRNTSNV